MFISSLSLFLVLFFAYAEKAISYHQPTPPWLQSLLAKGEKGKLTPIDLYALQTRLINVRNLLTWNNYPHNKEFDYVQPNDLYEGNPTSKEFNERLADEPKNPIYKAAQQFMQEGKKAPPFPEFFVKDVLKFIALSQAYLDRADVNKNLSKEDENKLGDNMQDMYNMLVREQPEKADEYNKTFDNLSEKYKKMIK